MIKKLLFVLLLIFSVGQKLCAQAPYIFYITETGERTNEKSFATSYCLVEKLKGDSAWSVKQFDMRNNILTAGYYKDENMETPSGKFTYYHKSTYTPNDKYGINTAIDTINHIQTTGYFVDGEKSGIWMDYSYGRKNELHTYQKGKLNGLYQHYGYNEKVSLEGNYVNDHKEGEWRGFDMEGTVIFTDSYNKKGVNVKHTNIKVDEYKPAVMPFDLYTYLRRRTSGFKVPDHVGTLILKLTISKEGAVTEAKVEQVADYEFDDLVVKAFMNSPKWKPAVSRGQKVDSSFRITLNVVELVGAQSQVN